MIKNFENFVNEGFIDNVFAGIDAGIGAFKANKNAEKVADEEMQRVLDGGEGEANNEVKLTVLVKQLVMKSALLADKYSWDYLVEKPNSAKYMGVKIEELEEILSKMKEILMSFE
jgi:hypothetical protein